MRCDWSNEVPSGCLLSQNNALRIKIINAGRPRRSITHTHSTRMHQVYLPECCTCLNLLFLLSFHTCASAISIPTNLESVVTLLEDTFARCFFPNSCSSNGLQASFATSFHSTLFSSFKESQLLASFICLCSGRSCQVCEVTRAKTSPLAPLRQRHSQQRSLN